MSFHDQFFLFSLDLKQLYLKNIHHTLKFDKSSKVYNKMILKIFFYNKHIIYRDFKRQ